ncbi:hypothetical protein [Amycolatopsis anabasis]|uniref:hypothetical protein n=1 Tax=Amycolatopsis anabasis TaxID=1840409 RepID=UPI00131BF385|nr:hypothetical protein [Amycolatopsis anabasis]
MDERELETLFREAPGEPPPAGFTVTDVTKASARAGIRSRNRVLVAVSCAVVLLAGGGLTGLLLNDGVLEQTASAPEFQSNADSGNPRQPGGGTGRPPNAVPQEGFPTYSPKQGGDGSGENGPRAEGTQGCDKVDRELATALAGELPVTGLQASPARWCAPDWRSAAFEVADTGRGGVISATVVPSGQMIKPTGLPQGTLVAERAAKGGGTVFVLSVPRTGSVDPPFPNDLDRIVTALAARF